MRIYAHKYAQIINVPISSGREDHEGYKGPNNLKPKEPYNRNELHDLNDFMSGNEGCRTFISKCVPQSHG